MVAVLSSLSSFFIKVPFLNRLFGRLVNKYTAHGIIIVVMQLESLGILPSGVASLVDGLPTKEVAGYLIVALGIYFIFHRPKFKNKVERKQEELELLRAELEIKQIKEQLEKDKGDESK